jgi:hypothetical protein
MRKRTFRILTGLAIILLGLGVVYGIAVAISTAKLRRAYAALQADGRPMDRKEIIPSPIADTNNAALLYQSAISLLQAEPSGQNRKSPPGASKREQIEREKCNDLLSYLRALCVYFGQDAPTPAMQQELKELMGRKAVDYALFAIEQGTQRPACRQECDYDAGMNLRLPPLQGLRSIAYIVGTKARLEAEAGQMDRAWHWATVQAKLADALRAEPLLICQLVRMSMIQSSYDTIQHLCEIAPPGAEQREQLDTILSTFDDATPLVRAMDGERLLYGEWLFTLPRKELHEAVQDLRFSRMPEPIAWLMMRWLTIKPLLLADHADYIRIMHTTTQSMERPYPSQVPEYNGRFSLTGMLLPAFGRVKTLHCQTAAQVRMTRAGLALLRYRADHGTFPASLDALNMDNLSDPFTQRPLHYRPEDEGFLLYSVGEDLKDNGGAPRPERRDSQPGKKQHPEYDIPWRFPSQISPP